jgi:hypothetical protein
MYPDSNRSKTPAEKRRKFKKFLEDVDAADPKVLRLFPSMDFEVMKGLQTALRVLLVAAEDGYVNENELSKYGVGGDSRHKILPRLCNLGLLTRSEEVSSKGGKKFVHRLSDKGVVICAAFPRIFRSRDLFVSLIKNHVANKSLAHTMLTLYLGQAAPRKNQLLESLRFASDSGLNIEHASEENLAERLLQAEEAMSTDPQEAFLFKLGEEFIDWIYSASDEDLARMRDDLSGLLGLLRSEDPEERAFARNVSAKMIIGFRDVLQFLRSSDFQVWTRASNKNMKRLREIVLEVVQAEAGDIVGGGVDGLRTAWRNRRRIAQLVRKRLREESFSLISAMETRRLEATS